MAMAMDMQPTVNVGRRWRMTNIAITKYWSEDSTAQTPGPPVEGPVAGQVTEHHPFTFPCFIEQ